MKPLSRRFLTAWYAGVVFYAALLFALAPVAIPSLAKRSAWFGSPALAVLATDGVGVIAALAFPAVWRVQPDNQRWLGLWRVGSVLCFGILIVGILWLNIQLLFV